MDQNVSKDEARVIRFTEGATEAPGRSAWQNGRYFLLIVAGVLAVLALGGFYGRDFWTTGRFMVSTDDAYLEADSVIISPKVSGYIEDVSVSDNQSVIAGYPLARIDDRDYRTALSVAQANVDAQQAAIGSLMQRIALQQITVPQVGTAVTSDQAALAFSTQDYQRYIELAQTGFGTR